jgi:hypothetical protein
MSSEDGIINRLNRLHEQLLIALFDFTPLFGDGTA